MKALKKRNTSTSEGDDTLLFAKCLRLLLFPEKIFPRTQPLMGNGGNPGGGVLGGGGLTISNSLWTTWPRMLLLGAGVFTSDPSDKIHSPDMVCKESGKMLYRMDRSRQMYTDINLWEGNNALTLFTEVVHFFFRVEHIFYLKCLR